MRKKVMPNEIHSVILATHILILFCAFKGSTHGQEWIGKDVNARSNIR